MSDVSQKSMFKILYSLLFMVMLPAILYFWATYTDKFIPFYILRNDFAGFFLVSSGFIIMFTAMINLYVHGHGLPMSPYPPSIYVKRGMYRIFSHPIYTGTIFICAGFSIAWGSASGFWLVTPVYTLACVAFVMGFEGEFIRSLFQGSIHKPLFSFPEVTSEKARIGNYFSAYALALIPTAIAFYLVLISGISQISTSDYTSVITNVIQRPFSASFHILTQFIAICLIVMTPLFLQTKIALRNFSISIILYAALGLFTLLILPASWSQYFFNSLWLACALLPLQTFSQRFSRYRYIFYGISLVFLAVCFYLNDAPGIIALTLMIYLLVAFRNTVWEQIQRSAEFVANSWKEWRFGKIRVINHGFLGGLSSGTGTFVMASLLGPQYFVGIFIVAVCIMLTMILWAQIVEGSDQLKRPAGFYGGVLGMAIGASIAHFTGLANFFVLAAVAAICGPWAQGIGRLRCLVQGCCHGKETTSTRGIRYFHERSRVVRLANLKGKYVYPTPVYSIITNIFTAIILFKLWFNHTPLPMILGICLIINSLSRFVEESYRGEPQTPMYYGLRLYQWVAIIVFIIGIGLTTLDSPQLERHFVVDFGVLGLSLASAVLGFFVTGVDFPESNKRFSRLT